METSTTRPEPREIRFYFDYLSPFAYIAWTQIHALAERHGCVVEPRPILFAALLGAHGQKGPAEIPAKRLYVFKDAFRKAARAGLPPLTPPSRHPFHPLVALRASLVPADASTRRRLIDALYVATWAGGDGIDSEERVAAVATSIGLDGEAIVREAASQVIKDRLRADTEEALGTGAFGVPTMVVDGELFWGRRLVRVSGSVPRREGPAGPRRAAALDPRGAVRHPSRAEMTSGVCSRPPPAERRDLPRCARRLWLRPRRFAARPSGTFGGTHPRVTRFARASPLGDGQCRHALAVGSRSRERKAREPTESWMPSLDRF